MDVTPGTDFVGAFRAYAQKALGNDFNAEKAAATLNTWVKESGDALKERIERETEKAVKKLGLAKESDVKALQSEVRELQKALGIKKNSKDSEKPKKTKNSSAKKSSKSVRGGSAGTAKKSASGKVRKSATKKASR